TDIVNTFNQLDHVFELWVAFKECQKNKHEILKAIFVLQNYANTNLDYNKEYTYKFDYTTSKVTRKEEKPEAKFSFGS
ncbi:hypothetical protein EBX93_17110, partial [bacterium]|nr:hypothetical protein [bacterium]